ncbi:MAG: hypothetical protein WDM81_16095 [Rhizomicrobium sp.]
MIEALRRVKAAGLKTGCITNNMPHNASGSTPSWPLALCQGDHGAVRRRDRKRQDRHPQAEPEDLRDDVRAIGG